MRILVMAVTVILIRDEDFIGSRGDFLSCDEDRPHGGE